jgi:hypothetical protein
VTLDTAADALVLLAELGAGSRLVRHHQLVAEAATLLVDGLAPLGVGFDAREVVLGAALHDAGKILHPAEMAGPGSQHEVAGRELLASHGLGPLARFCVTHASWRDENIGLEDLLVALADKLWKGKRVDELERRVVGELARASGREFWAVFLLADALFESIAATGDERLAHS